MEGTKTEAYEVTDFQREVIDASHERAVLVDFWAAWCGPCRALGPVLEKLAEEVDAPFTLVKVNTDLNPEISTQYGIRGIPAVKLFVDGEVVDEFTGALPEYAVRQWLEKAIPSPQKLQVEESERAIDSGETERARELLDGVLEEEPQNPKARILLARLLALSDPQRAIELVDGAAFAGASYVQLGEAVKTLAEFAEAADSPDNLPDDPARSAYVAAARAMREGRYDETIDQLIEILKVNRYYHDDAARRAGVALFMILGDEHEITRSKRRMFDMWLY